MGRLRSILTNLHTHPILGTPCKLQFTTDGVLRKTVKTFKEIQELVDGYVEAIRLSDNHPIQCAINEEGQIRNLPANPHVTIEYDNTPLPPNVIVIGERLPYICGNIVALPNDWEAQLEANHE